MGNGLSDLNISNEFHPYLSNLSRMAESPDRIPFIGREKEIEAVMESLLRKLKKNVILVGRPGVGKTALITEIAARINQGRVPAALRDKIVLEMSMNAFVFAEMPFDELLAGVERLFSEIQENRDRILFFLDEMQTHSIMGGERDGQLARVQKLMRSRITDRGLSVIAATTPENFYRFAKNDEELSMGFSPVLIEEPSRKEMLKILEGVRPYFEAHHGLVIPPALFKRVYLLAQRFIPHRAFPHKAIELLDMSCSKCALKGHARLRLDFLYRSVSEMSRLPLDIVRLDPHEHAQGIEKFLGSVVVNQRTALSEISRIIRLSRMEAGINRNRPEGIFLFLGATGIGKSYVAGRVAEYLFGSRDKLRVIDLADFKKPADCIRLIGDRSSGAGVLVQEVEDHPFSVILFERIDEAHSAVLSFLGRILTRGVVMDPFGIRHPLSSIVFILNLTRIGEERREYAIGFVKGEDASAEVVIPRKIMDVLDWVDEIIEFSTLTQGDLEKIAAENLRILVDDFKRKHAVAVELADGIQTVIAERALKEGTYAHAVGRIIDREIRLELLDAITRAARVSTLEVRVKRGAFSVFRGRSGKRKTSRGTRR